MLNKNKDFSFIRIILKQQTEERVAVDDNANNFISNLFIKILIISLIVKYPNHE
jgi:hypothetical protein